MVNKMSDPNEQYNKFLEKFERLTNIAWNTMELYRDKETKIAITIDSELSKSIERFRKTLDNSVIAIVLTMSVCTFVLMIK